MAERAKPKKKSAAKGKVSSRGTVATLPKKAKKAGVGHNSGKIPDEVYQRHLAKIDTTDKAMQKAKEVYDQAKGVHQSAYKLAKQDGCDVDAIRLARRLDRQDHGVTQVTYANVSRVLNLMKSPLGSDQMDLFGSIQEVAPKVDIALQGQQAGKEGADRGDNPYEPGSAEFAIYDENWLLGQAQIAKTLGRGNDATQH